MFKNKIALIVVVTWVVGILTCLIFAGLDTKPDRWMAFLKEFSAITGPLVGAIAGYYFKQ